MIAMKPLLMLRLFWLVVAAELLLIYFQWGDWRWFTKPLLMPLLLAAIFFHKGSTDRFFKGIIIAALMFSWMGDILLQAKNLFIPGLISFLIAHLFYIVYFLKAGRGEKGLLQFQPLIGIPVVLYLFIFLMLLYPFLDSMKIPVTIYGITICSMLLCSINLRRKISDNAAILFFHGALQFVISDSLLAVNLFAFPHWMLSLCVMLSYCSAQYLLVRAHLLHVEKHLQ